MEVVRVNIHVGEPVAFYLGSWERHRRALRERIVLLHAPYSNSRCSSVARVDILGKNS